MRFSHIILLLFSITAGHVSAQQKRIDSLINNLPLSRDTNRANALIAVSRELLRKSPDQAKKFIDEAFAISTEKKYLKGQATCLLGYGLAAFYGGDLSLAEKKYTQAIAIGLKSGNLKILSRAYNNMGLLNDQRSNYEQAIFYYMKALQIAETQHDRTNIARTLNNMGILYGQEGKTDLALQYHRRSLEQEILLNDKEGIASSLTNIGLAFKQQGQIDSCMSYYLRALQMREDLEDPAGIALVLHNIAGIYLEKGRYAEAEHRLLNILALCRKSGDQVLYCHALINLGQCFGGMKNYPAAIAYLDSALQSAGRLGSREMKMQALHQLSGVYKDQKDFRKALSYNKTASLLQDSIYNVNNKKIIFETQSRYKSESKESELELLKQRTELEQIRLKHDRTLISTLSAGVLLFFVLCGLVYSRSVVKNRSNRLLEEQNSLLEKQKQEITDSISYAHNIQQAMLPPADILKAGTADHFVFHKPKDIVSGDFYFVDTTGPWLVFSAVDCTGHGVPGALLSFLGMDILQDAVSRQGVYEPGRLLQMLDREISLRLRKKQDDESVRDGMDLAICSLNLDTLELLTAGAFNPVYIISDGILEEIKPDKHAIGSNYTGASPDFRQHTRQMKKGDCIYVLSDGFADQFGGPAGKKFKYKPLKELLISNAAKPMDIQKMLLEKTLDSWKGNLFQVDDILIIGIRI